MHWWTDLESTIQIWDLEVTIFWRNHLKFIIFKNLYKGEQTVLWQDKHWLWKTCPLNTISLRFSFPKWEYLTEFWRVWTKTVCARILWSEVKLCRCEVLSKVWGTSHLSAHLSIAPISLPSSAAPGQCCHWTWLVRLFAPNLSLCNCFELYKPQC